jgi:hypothetical protein
MMRYCKPIDWLKIKKETIAIKFLIISHRNRIVTQIPTRINIIKGQPKNTNRNIIKYKLLIIFNIYKHRKQKISTVKPQYMTID